MLNVYNLLYREEERERKPYCADAGIGMTLWGRWRTASWMRGSATLRVVAVSTVATRRAHKTNDHALAIAAARNGGTTLPRVAAGQAGRLGAHRHQPCRTPGARSTPRSPTTRSS